jgi:O-antigen/teichoic acid export membrane protein
VVGPAEYGLYFSLLSLTYLFQIINDFGIQQYNNQLIAKRKDLLVSHLKGFLGLKILLALLFTFFVIFGAYILGHRPNFYILVFIIVNQILTSLVLYLRSNISGLGFYKQDSILSVMDKLLMIIVCGYLLFFWKGRAGFSIFTFIYAQLFSLLFTAFVALIFLFRQSGFIRIHLNYIQAKDLIQKTWPYALAVFLMTIYTRIDSVMVERMLPSGDFHAGVYAAAYRLLDAANMFAFLFAVLLLPMFSKLLGDFSALKKLLKLSFKLMLVLVIGVSIPSFFHRQDLMTFLYIEGDAYWGNVFGVLILCFIAIGSMYIFGTLMTAIGHMKKLNILYAVCVILNITFNLILIPKYQSLGAAMATLVTQFLVTTGLAWFVLKEFDFRIQYHILFQVTGFIALSVLLTYINYVFFDVNWYFQFLLSLIVILILAFLFRLFKLSYFREMIKGL